MRASSVRQILLGLHWTLALYMAALVAWSESKVLLAFRSGEMAQVWWLTGGWLALSAVVFPLALLLIGRLWGRWVVSSAKALLSAASAFTCASMTGALAPALMMSMSAHISGSQVMMVGGAMTLFLVGVVSGLGGVANGVTTRDAPC
jgi:hypothetical protein